MDNTLEHRRMMDNNIKHITLNEAVYQIILTAYCLGKAFIFRCKNWIQECEHLMENSFGPRSRDLDCHHLGYH